MSMTNIIVNADDFGLNHNIADMIIKGHDVGMITSTTFMTNAPAAQYAAKLVKQRPNLGVGVHLNITTGRPLSDPDRLPGLVTPDGCFLSPLKTTNRLIFDFRLVGPILQEYSQQVERCLDLGITPTHLDTHHGMHRFPVVFEAFQRTLQRYRIRAARSQVSLVIQAKPSTNLRGGDVDVCFRQERGMKGAWKRLCTRRMRASGIRTADAQLRTDLTGLGDVSPLEWFDFLLRYAPQGTFEIVLHPGMLDESERVPDGNLDVRLRDTALVEQSDRPGERLSGKPIRFISYAELARPTG